MRHTCRWIGLGILALLSLSEGASLADLSPKQIELGVAIRANDPAQVKTLLSKMNPKEDLDFRAFHPDTPKGDTLLTMAARIGNTKVLALLVPLAPLSDTTPNSRGGTPLSIAAQEDHAKAVTFLIKEGANPNQTDENGEQSPLAIAIEYSRYESAAALLKAGVDPNGGCNVYRGDPSQPPLHLNYLRHAVREAETTGDTKLVKLLLSYGADRRKPSSDGYLAIHAAAQWGKPETLRVLLKPTLTDRFADLINAPDPSGATPLLLASQEGQKKNVDFLLSRGARGNIARFDGVTPLYFAQQENHPEIADMLIKRGNLHFQYEIALAKECGNPQIIGKLVRAQFETCQTQLVKRVGDVLVAAKNFEHLSTEALHERASDCFTEIEGLKEIEKKLGPRPSGGDEALLCPIGKCDLLHAKTLVAPACGHLVCEACYMDMLAQPLTKRGTFGEVQILGPRCPLCRTPLYGKTVMEINLEPTLGERLLTCEFPTLSPKSPNLETAPEVEPPPI